MKLTEVYTNLPASFPADETWSRLLLFPPVRLGAVIVSASICVCIALQGGCRRPPQSPQSRGEIELHYEAKLAALGFASPLLRGTMNGQSAWFIIDTGASVQTLASWLVTEAGIVTHATSGTIKGSTGVDTVVRAINGATVHVSGREDVLSLREAIVVDFPRVFQEQRIGGLLSPQLLAPAKMAAILDLRAPRLNFGPAPVASTGTRVCRNSGSLFVNRLYAAPASTGGIEALMLVDTGATSSVIAPSSPLTAALAGRKAVSGHTQGVGGSAMTTRKVPNVAMKLGGGEATVSLTIGNRRRCAAPTACWAWMPCVDAALSWGSTLSP